MTKGETLKVVNVCIQDFAAGAYGLSHALNKMPGVESVAIRTSNNYINYPAMAEARMYGPEGCKRIIESADAVVFHSAVRPFFTAYKLDPEVMKKKRLFLYLHGSECRNYGQQLLTDAFDCLGNFQALLSTPDLLSMVPDGSWMPVARDFNQIRRLYGKDLADLRALKAFDADIKKVLLTHAPTNEATKGSPVFYSVITEMLDNLTNIEFQAVQAQPWDSCLRILAKTNILYDQWRLGAYGMVAVEASIFGAAIFCCLDPKVAEFMAKESGLPQPFIQWQNIDELRTQSYMLAQDTKLQQRFGKMALQYCKKMHDDPNVARRFLALLKGNAPTSPPKFVGPPVGQPPAPAAEASPTPSPTNPAPSGATPNVGGPDQERAPA